MNNTILIENIKEASSYPTSLLTEITENELINKATETQNASQGFDYRDVNTDPEYRDQINTGERLNNDFSAGNMSGQKGDVNLGKVLNPAFAVTMIDAILPLALSLLFTKFLDIKTNKKEFQLSAKEKNEIEPFIKEALETVNVNFSNPLIALGVVLSAIYGTKAIEVYSNKPEKPESTGTGAGVNANGTPKKDGRGRPKKH